MRSKKPRPASHPGESRRSRPAEPLVGTPATGPALPAGRWSWREPYLIPLLLLLGSRLLFALILPLAAEDAYITFRYALNLQAGNGLVYNPGEHVMGFSSPLWTLWNALGIRLLHNPVLWSRAWSLLADAVALLVLTHLVRREAGRASAWCFAVFFSCWTYFAALAASGMEMSLLLALMAVGAASSGRPGWLGGPTLAALAATRPEGLAAALVLGTGMRWRERLVAIALVAVTGLVLWWQFGTVLPQSVIAKAEIYGIPGPWAGRLWWEWLSPLPLGTWGLTSEGQILSRMAIVSGPAVVAGMLWLWRRRGSALTRFVLAASVAWLGYAILGVSYFSWYLAVPLVVAGILAAIGFPHIVRGPALYAGAALFVLGSWLIAPMLYIDRARGEARGFYQMARRLAEQARPGDKVMLEPIGIIGFSCPVVVVDETGLVSPRVAQRRRQGPGWLADVAAAERPEWWILRRSELTDTLSFAGAGQPFRSAAERDSLLARYAVTAWVNRDAGDLALALLRRTR